MSSFSVQVSPREDSDCKQSNDEDFKSSDRVQLTTAELIAVRVAKGDSNDKSRGTVFICIHGYGGVWNQLDNPFISGIESLSPNPKDTVLLLNYDSNQLLNALNFESACKEMKSKIEMHFERAEKLVFIGHSFGCLFSTALASSYNEEFGDRASQLLAVLLDPVHADEFYRDRLNLTRNEQARNAWTLRDFDLLPNLNSMFSQQWGGKLNKVIFQVHISLKALMRTAPHEVVTRRLIEWSKACSHNARSALQLHSCGHMIHRQRCTQVLSSIGYALKK